MDDAIRHHVWATDVLLDTCADLSESQLRQSMPAMYGGVLDTLRHLVDSDGWYVFRLEGSKGEHGDLDGEADLAVIRRLAAENAAAWERLMKAGLESDREIVSASTEGPIVHTFVGVRVAQAVHHGTDHRSQVCTALTTFGIEPPDVSVWGWAEAVGRFREEPPAS
jgi:uncharacterized damage-inducible protein DinB